MFTRILVANRGEIAVRILRTCRVMGIETVAVYSDADAGALHVTLADQAVRIGGAAPAESYLSQKAILDAARATGAQAIHPGYGFLSENDAFAAACAKAGLTFIGPSPDAMAKLGSKTAARRIAEAAGVPVVPGAVPADQSDAALIAAATKVGFPVLLKPSEGGGGIGMKEVHAAADLPGAIAQARREAEAAFGDGTLYVERLVTKPRHVEFQILGDSHGTVVHLFERECSIQRRHQKVLEETPSIAVSESLRAAIAEAAARIARAVAYTNAGTIEFLLGDDGKFYFLEMNTRLQVEHPITEAVTGIDLVQWQFRLAEGARLDIDPDAALRPRGHAIEARVYAEDPDLGFLPSPGRIVHLRAPAGPGIRDDSGYEPNGEVPIFYDSLVSKLIAWGANRTEAIARLQRALSEYEIAGIRTTIPFFQWLLTEHAFINGDVDTTMLDRVLASRNGTPFRLPDENTENTAAIAAALDLFFRSHTNGASGSAASTSAWTRTARRDALR